ncbi:hypothetical protein FACS189467_2560 [Bacteroidia bacterium]|nr:hypothetical protein FACS189467_2560 [Bacteroidia bacterium]
MFFRELHKYKAGIYTTLIFHLCVVIVLLGLKIRTVSYQIPAEIEIAFDEEKEQLRQQQEQREQRQQEEKNIQAELAREIRQQLAEERASAMRLRNVAVNEKTPTDNKDDVLAENAELQKRIAATYRMMREQNNSENAVLPSKAPKKAGKKGEKSYTGPSVLSYRVPGRKAYYLPVPVYKCEAGGQITVAIVVAQTGDVVSVQIDKTHSTTADNCLWETAVDAALRSKFDVGKGTLRQQGYIIYQFVAQR